MIFSSIPNRYIYSRFQIVNNTLILQFAVKEDLNNRGDIVSHAPTFLIFSSSPKRFEIPSRMLLSFSSFNYTYNKSYLLLFPRE